MADPNLELEYCFVIEDEETELVFCIDEYTQISPDEYQGPYDVIPKVDPQQLATANKLMKQDVTVWGVPYEEVSNLYGTTVNIAME